MARQQRVVRTSDITGEEIRSGEGGPVEFALDGVEYEFDAHDDGADEFRKLLAPFVAIARRVGGHKRPLIHSGTGVGAVEPAEARAELGVTDRAMLEVTTSPARPATNGTAGKRDTRTRPDRAQNQAMREWARANGFTVSERGRIPTEVSTAYDKAHPARGKGVPAAGR